MSAASSELVCLGEGGVSNGSSGNGGVLELVH